MRHPFPGMNPWLERPDVWPGVHHSLITAMRDALSPRVAPKYFVDVEERVYPDEDDLSLFLIPDATVSKAPPPDRVRDAAKTQGPPYRVRVPVPRKARVARLVVMEPKSRVVVTVIELLSPTNKFPGKGRLHYERKRLQLLGSEANLVEIDLLRAGAPMSVHGAPTMGDYRILVSRAEQRPRSDLYPFGVREAIPLFHVPLARMDAEPDLDLGELLQGAYDRAQYHLRIDYRGEPVPPLTDSDRSWANEVLLDAKLR